MINQAFLNKAQGCLLGVAIGDALGMPVETMKRAEIRTATNGSGITHFVAPLTNREWVQALKPGDTTDDWQLTAVVARSLINMKGFNLADMAKGHVEALGQSTFGWGKTTQRAIEEIRDGKRDLRSWAPDFGPRTGGGNGVIMKVAPIALHHAIRGQLEVKGLLSDIMQLAGLTHHDIRAYTTAFYVARLMIELFQRPVQKTEQVRELLPQIIKHNELGWAKQDVESAADRMNKLLDPKVSESPESLEAAVGNGFHCLDTMAFTIGTFMRHPTDFRAGVLEAVNAGGDSDTNASVVGALIGINCGLGAIPEEWRNFASVFQEPLELARQLFW